MKDAKLLLDAATLRALDRIGQAAAIRALLQEAWRLTREIHDDPDYIELAEQIHALNVPDEIVRVSRALGIEPERSELKFMPERVYDELRGVDADYDDCDPQPEHPADVIMRARAVLAQTLGEPQ